MIRFLILGDVKGKILVPELFTDKYDFDSVFDCASACNYRVAADTVVAETFMACSRDGTGGRRGNYGPPRNADRPT